MEERYKTFTVLISKINRNIKRLKTDVMAAYDLKVPHVSCMYYLYTEGALTPKQLSLLCDQDKGALSRSIDDLILEGLVENVNQGKKYRNPLRLTEKGKTIGENVAKKIDEIVQDTSSDITDEERAILFKCLGSVSDKLEEIVIANEEKV